MLRNKERTPTPYPSIISTYGFVVEFIKEFGGVLMRDFLGGYVFTLTHLCIFLLITIAHLTCVFTSFVDDMHIVGHASNAATIFLQL
jgi:hypothetical protein